MESIKKVYKYPLCSQTFGYNKYSHRSIFWTRKTWCAEQSDPIRGLEENLHTHMFNWCFHGYNWLDLQFANLPSVSGKTHFTFLKIWVLGYRHCLPMQRMWSQELECRSMEKCTWLASLITHAAAVCACGILIRVGRLWRSPGKKVS